MNQRKRPPLGGLLGVLLFIVPLSQAGAQTSAPAITDSVIRAVTPAVTREVGQVVTRTLASGGWVNKGYDIDGRWEIVARDDKRYIVFDDDFQTRSGPDLKVYLSSRPLAALSDRTVAPNSVEISPLKAARGAQEYEIPADLDLAEYRTVLIHCKKFSHLWGGGAIAP